MIKVDEDILVYAVRYAVGRRSYAVATVVDAIRSNWNELTQRAKLAITKEIKTAIENEEAGDPDIDVPLWKSILELTNKNDR